MKKKFLSILLATSMVVSLAACGSTATGTKNGDAASAGSGATSGSGTGGIQKWVGAADEKEDSTPGTNDDRAFKKFDHVVEVHIGEQIDAADKTLPKGDSADNNQYTRYLLDNYNIKIVADWTAGNAADRICFE